MKRFRKSAIALVLALLMALQGTEPIFVQAKEAIEDVQKNADFSRPEALTEEEAGMRTYKMKRRHQKIQRRRKNRQLQRKKQKKIRRKKK